MTEALKKTLLDFSNDKEPFLTHNHMWCCPCARTV